MNKQLLRIMRTYHEYWFVTFGDSSFEDHCSLASLAIIYIMLESLSESCRLEKNALTSTFPGYDGYSSKFQLDAI